MSDSACREVQARQSITPQDACLIVDALHFYVKLLNEGGLNGCRIKGESTRRVVIATRLISHYADLLADVEEAQRQLAAERKARKESLK